MDKYIINLQIENAITRDIKIETSEKDVISFEIEKGGPLNLYLLKTKELKKLNYRKYKISYLSKEKVIIKIIFPIRQRINTRLFNGIAPVVSSAPLLFQEFIKKKRKEGRIPYLTYSLKLKEEEGYCILVTFDQEKINTSNRDPSFYNGLFFYLERLVYPEFLKENEKTTISTLIPHNTRKIPIESSFILKYLGENNLLISEITPEQILIEIKREHDIPLLDNIQLNKYTVSFDSEKLLKSKVVNFTLLENKLEVLFNEKFYEEYILKKGRLTEEEIEDQKSSVEQIKGISMYFSFFPEFLNYVNNSDLRKISNPAKRKYYSTIKTQIEDIDISLFTKPDRNEKSFSLEKRTTYYCDTEIIFLNDYSILFSLNPDIELKALQNIIEFSLEERIDHALNEFYEKNANKLELKQIRKIPDDLKKFLLKILVEFKLKSNILIQNEDLTHCITLLSLFLSLKKIFYQRFDIKEIKALPILALYNSFVLKIKDVKTSNRLTKTYTAYLQEITENNKNKAVKLLRYSKGLDDLYQTKTYLDKIYNYLADIFYPKDDLYEIAEDLIESIRNNFNTKSIFKITSEEIKRRLLKDYIDNEEIDSSLEYLQSFVKDDTLIEKVESLFRNNLQKYYELNMIRECAGFLAKNLYSKAPGRPSMMATASFNMLLIALGLFDRNDMIEKVGDSPYYICKITDINLASMYRLVYRFLDINTKETDFSDILEINNLKNMKLREIIFGILIINQIELAGSNVKKSVFLSIIKKAEFLNLYPSFQHFFKQSSTVEKLKELKAIVKEKDKELYERLLAVLDSD